METPKPLQRIFPADYRFQQRPVFNYTIDGIDGGDLLGVLSTLRFLEVFFAGHPNNSTFIYGWVNAPHLQRQPGLGGRLSGLRQYRPEARHQRTLALELGHNFGPSTTAQDHHSRRGLGRGRRTGKQPAA
ncbi:MAG: hypothetical protein IPJ00_22580, partial [Saprospirales bacterium]|nr:hypothetical protein [Saprospirales bacterium]